MPSTDVFNGQSFAKSLWLFALNRSLMETELKLKPIKAKINKQAV